jgi:hypothetical protein
LKRISKTKPKAKLFNKIAFTKGKSKNKFIAITSFSQINEANVCHSHSWVLDTKKKINSLTGGSESKAK